MGLVQLLSLRSYPRSIPTYLLTPWNRVLPEKITCSPIVKKFPAFYGTRTFIIAFTSARHLSLSGARSIQSMHLSTYFLKIHLNIIPPSKPASSKWTLSLRFPHQNPVYASPLPICLTCPTQLTLLDLVTQIIYGEQYRSLSSSLRSFPHSPVASYLSGPNILIRTLFSNTLSLRYPSSITSQIIYSLRHL